MAKNQGIDPKASTAARIKRTEAYAEKVRLLFAQTVNDILAINKTMPKLDDGVMFSFDGENLKKQKEVEALLRRLHSSVTMAIREGVNLEWAQANAEADKLVKSVFGQAVLDSPEFTAWTQRNTAARDAFLARSEKGLNLSDRVWKSVRQLRDELEVAVTVSMGEGKSASAMSREVRQYLNDPDLMFRRFRYKKGEDKDGNPVYGRKWKKRVKDEATGKYKWIDYDRDSYKTGAGVYKSSAKNAMRLTRTETNIAYRRADHERWQQMDFVLGQRVQLSKNHPRPDICDKLQGDYPKEFVFDGWHPQCFCFVTPILVDEEEMAKVNEAFLKGEKYIPKGKKVTEYPDSFKDWVREHAEDIADARDRGTEPYFIRNNAGVIDGILNPQPKELSIAEKAALRHAARTPEQEDAIRRAWEQRNHERAVIKKGAGNVLKVAQDWPEVDYSDLQAAIGSGDYMRMQAASKAVAQSIVSMRQQEQALSSLIPDVHSWHKQFTMSELQDVYQIVEDKLKQWAGLSDTELMKKLKFEAIDYLGGNMKGVQQKYKTWEVSQVAYLKKLQSTAEKAMLDAMSKGDIYSAGFASDYYASAVLEFSNKRYSQQNSVLSLQREKEAAKAMKKYLKETPSNPHYIWGGNIGGVWGSMETERQLLEAELNGVTADELSLITRFTSGMTFYNAYNLRNTSAYWKKVWEDKMAMLSVSEQKEMKRIIQEYTLALDGVNNKMKRYEGVVYRGVHSDGGAELLAQFQSAWKGNKTWVNTASASSSTDITVSYYSFDNRGKNDLIMVIRNKSGAYIRPISEYNSEKEVLLMKDTKYRLLKEPYQINGKWFVELEEI